MVDGATISWSMEMLRSLSLVFASNESVWTWARLLMVRWYEFSEFEKNMITVTRQTGYYASEIEGTFDIPWFTMLHVHQEYLIEGLTTYHGQCTGWLGP